jgi:hypothetical protein
MTTYYVVETQTSGGWTFEQACATRAEAERVAAECGDQCDEAGDVLCYGLPTRVRRESVPEGYAIWNGRLSLNTPAAVRAQVESLRAQGCEIED